MPFVEAELHTPNVGFIDFCAHGPRAYRTPSRSHPGGQKVVTTSTCARIGVPTCSEHVPHTTSATIKPPVTSEDIILGRSSTNSRRLLCEDFETTREYWLPRQSLSRPSGSPALGDAQSRWNQGGRPRRSILARYPPCLRYFKHVRTFTMHHGHM